MLPLHRPRVPLIKWGHFVGTARTHAIVELVLIGWWELIVKFSEIL